jgi:hypothetical protein
MAADGLTEKGATEGARRGLAVSTCNTGNTVVFYQVVMTAT